MNPVAIRLLSQQLAAPQYSDPAEVVSYMGAMQVLIFLALWSTGGWKYCKKLCNNTKK